MKLRWSFFLSLCLATVVIFGKAHRLDTLDDFVRYAATLPESTAWSGDWQNPDFDNVIFSQSPSILDRFVDTMGFGAIKWHLADLKDLLLRVTAQRKVKTYEQGIGELIGAEGDKFIFLGDLHGAFHSFLRDLQELERQGLITQGLKIANGSRVVLLGNVIARSPYSLQLLTLICLLLERNPDRFFLMGSENEKNGFWDNFLNMRIALITYNRPWWESNLKKPRSPALPLENELTEFFNSLPDTLVLRYKDVALGKVYFAQEQINPDLLVQASTKALILGDTQQMGMAKRYAGLKFVGYNYGTTCWSIMSSPVTANQDHLGFYLDSFVILTLGKNFRDGSLTHYFRDVRKKEGFSKYYADLLSGIVRSSENEMKKFQKMPFCKFGSMSALFGGYGAAGVPIKQGIDIAVAQLNDQGGVNGHLLYPVVFDDEYEGRLAGIYARKLTDEYGIDIFVGPQGTPTLKGYLDRVKKGEIAVLFPRSGAVMFYNKDLKYIVNSIASVADEVHALMDQMVNEFKIKTFSFVYPADDFGLPFMATVREELKKHGITSTYDVTYEHGQTDFTEQLKKMRESTDEGAGIFMTGNAPIREFLSGLGMEFFLSKAVFATSFLDSRPFNQFVEERGIRFTMSFPIPDPRGVDLPIFRDLLKALKPYALDYNAAIFEGYLAVRLFADALAHLTPPFTKEAVLRYFEGLKNYNFAGLDLTFRPEFRDLNLPVFIMTSERRWVKYLDQKKVAEGPFLTEENGDEEE